MRKIKRVIAMLIFGWPCFAQAQVDPTRPQTYVDNTLASQQNSALSLLAVFIKGNTKHAIINGKSYEEGQEIQGFTITLITPSKVELSGLQGMKLLYVNSNNIKKETNDDF